MTLRATPLRAGAFLGVRLRKSLPFMPATFHGQPEKIVERCGGLYFQSRYRINLRVVLAGGS
tara:strand:- start:293 stop:478 length:186 start_codon:yes stop_codon:yes gene_type:complete